MRSGKKNELERAGEKHKTVEDRPNLPAREHAPAKDVIGTESVEEFFARGKETARKADAGLPIAPSRRISFEDPRDLAAVLTPRRIELLRAVRRHSSSITEIAAELSRDRRAVARDVALMKRYGLLKVKTELNPSHGRRTRVEAEAASFELRATL